jgi:enoyl-[acyl-carrier protein] reductase II
MIRTRITEEYGLSAPICCAGMAIVAMPELAAAVSNAGGLGTFGTVPFPPDGLRAALRRTRTLTGALFGLDIIPDVASDAHIDVCVEERLPLAIFFWSPPRQQWLDALRAVGTRIWMQVGSVAEAREAAALGVDAIICQGAEGGGHNKAVSNTFSLLPAVRAAVAPIPVIAAGGITDGRGLAAALALGAEAVWCGTRFLASTEANAHADYKQRVVDARDGDTVISPLFGPSWPAPMRLFRNRVVREWAGREQEAFARLAGSAIIGTFRTGSMEIPMDKFSTLLPTAETTGDLEEMALTMGESSANITDIRPAAEIVATMAREAEDVLRELARRAAP